MPSITINGSECTFEPGQTILQVANSNDIEIPYYCYHDALSIPAQCRICLAEIWAPNPRNDGKLEPFMGGKLLPTCSTPASDGMVVRSDSPKAVANQKAVMEFLLINHPLDCPVCDQAGECELQDYSFKYGRGTSRFEESKVKQAKKDLGPHVYLYSDRCIMCTRCVRFTREIPGTGEITIAGRGNKSEIDVFPGVALANELSANVIDLCPVGALLDKDFLFTQRVWFLKKTPSIDGLTSSGDNIWVEHNEGKVYRFKPRDNAQINKHWITDEVRYGWKFVHSAGRITQPLRRQYGTLVDGDWNRVYDDAVAGIEAATATGQPLALLASPMLSSEDAFSLAMAAKSLSDNVIVGLGPVPRQGEDKVFPPTAGPEDPKRFVMRAEKAPNARGVRRVLEAVFGQVHDFDAFTGAVGGAGAVILTGNYPSRWTTDALTSAIDGVYTVLIDTLASDLFDQADVVLPSCTWLEKTGSFENATETIQAFEQAIPVVGSAKSEGQIGRDLLTVLNSEEAEQPVFDGYVEGLTIVDEQAGQVPTAKQRVMRPTHVFNPVDARGDMASQYPALGAFLTDIQTPAAETKQRADVEMIEL